MHIGLQRRVEGGAPQRLRHVPVGPGPGGEGTGIHIYIYIW